MSKRGHALNQQQRFKLASLQQQAAPHQPLGLERPKITHRSAFAYTQPTLQPLDPKQAAAGDKQEAERLERVKTAADDAYVAASELPYVPCCEAAALVQRLSEQIEQQMICNAIMQNELAAANPQALPALTVPQLSRTLAIRRPQFALKPNGTSVLDLLEQRGLNTPASMKGTLHELFPRDSTLTRSAAAKAAAAAASGIERTESDCHICHNELRNGQTLHKTLCCNRLFHLDCAYAYATRKHSKRECLYCYKEWASDYRQSIEQEHLQQKQRAALEQRLRRHGMLEGSSKRSPSSLFPSRRPRAHSSPSSSADEDSNDDAQNTSAPPEAPAAPSRLPHGRRVKAKPAAASLLPESLIGSSARIPSVPSLDRELEHLRDAWSAACAATDDAAEAKAATNQPLPPDPIDPGVYVALQDGSWMTLPTQFVSIQRIESDQELEPPSSMHAAHASNHSQHQPAVDLTLGDFEDANRDEAPSSDGDEAPSSNSQPDADDDAELLPVPPPHQPTKRVLHDDGGLAPMDIETE